MYGCVFKRVKQKPAILLRRNHPSGGAGPCVTVAVPPPLQFSNRMAAALSAMIQVHFPNTHWLLMSTLKSGCSQSDSSDTCTKSCQGLGLVRYVGILCLLPYSPSREGFVFYYCFEVSSIDLILLHIMSVWDAASGTIGAFSSCRETSS